MRFRISHILLLMILVAFFSFIMSTGSYFGYNVVRFLTWLLFCVLSIRAIVRPGRERMIMLSGLLVAISYLVCTRYILTNWQFPTSQLLNYAFENQFVSQYGSSRETFRTAAKGAGEHAFALLFGFAGAWLAAYWTKSDDSSTADRSN